MQRDPHVHVSDAIPHRPLSREASKALRGAAPFNEAERAAQRAALAAAGAQVELSPSEAAERLRARVEAARADEAAARARAEQKRGTALTSVAALAARYLAAADQDAAIATHEPTPAARVSPQAGEAGPAAAPRAAGPAAAAVATATTGSTQRASRHRRGKTRSLGEAISRDLTRSSTPPRGAGGRSAVAAEATDSTRPSTARDPEWEPAPLARNPRVLRHWRRRCDLALVAVRQANDQAIRRQLSWLKLPGAAYDLCADICSDERACAGALEWVRLSAGPALAIEFEQCALYRVPGARQRDDWSCARARRKLALLVFLLLSPLELPRGEVTGSTSTEPVLVTAGVSQTLLIKLLRSGQRAPYNVRTLQRDLAEIKACSDVLLRWRTPAEKAQCWESGPRGVMNRYCVRAGMIRERWRRCVSAGQALARSLALRCASFMVWRPRPRGELVPAPVYLPT